MFHETKLSAARLFAFVVGVKQHRNYFPEQCCHQHPGQRHSQKLCTYWLGLDRGANSAKWWDTCGANSLTSTIDWFRTFVKRDNGDLSSSHSKPAYLFARDGIQLLHLPQHWNQQRQQCQLVAIESHLVIAEATEMI